MTTPTIHERVTIVSILGRGDHLDWHSLLPADVDGALHAETRRKIADHVRVMTTSEHNPAIRFVIVRGERVENWTADEALVVYSSVRELTKLKWSNDRLLAALDRLVPMAMNEELPRFSGPRED